MARGDYIDIVYKVGSETQTERVIANGVGGSVELEEPRDKDPYVVVKELSRSDGEVRVARFAKGEVIAIIEGHVTLGVKIENS